MLKKVAFAFFLFVICGFAQDLAIDVTLENINEQKIINNPEHPKLGYYDLILHEEVSIGVEDEDIDYILGRPLTLDISKSGCFFIGEREPICIKVYDSAGKYLRTIGRKGQGPGEFMSVNFILDSDENVFFSDFRNQRTSVIDTLGTHIRMNRVTGLRDPIKPGPQSTYFYELKFNKNSDRSEKNHMEQFTIKVFLSDYEGNIIVNYGEFRGEKHSVKHYSEGGASMGGSLTPAKSVWNVDESGELYIGYNETYQIQVFEGTGKQKFIFGREYKKFKNKNYKKKRPAEMKILPAFGSKFLFSDQNEVWIELYNKTKDDKYLYDIFSKDGIYLKQVQVKHKIKLLKHGKIYCLRKDLDYPTVQRFSYDSVKVK